MTDKSYAVGGVTLPRPFRITRLGHVGLNVTRIEETLRFYRDLLGFRLSDTLNFAAMLSPSVQRPADRSGIGFFLHYGSDHHSLVLFPEVAAHIASSEILGEFPDQVTTNQIAWQVGGLRQVIEGNRWMRTQGRRIVFSGRDVPGSNFHFYTTDDEGHINEVFYGMEQIGWDGRSKPEAVRQIIGYMEPPAIPHRSESAELAALALSGIDLDGGHTEHERLPETYDVEGVMLARPFRVGKVGPVHLFVRNVETGIHFYRDLLGLTVTEKILWHGHRCAFLRAGTEHHSVGLYPIALREELQLSAHTTVLSIGMQLRSYAQLRAAIAYLEANQVTIRRLPPELFPGIDYSAFAIDPCGHAIQLHYYMERVSWDGRPRPSELRRKIDNLNWPETLEPLSDSFDAEPFFGPLG